MSSVFGVIKVKDSVLSDRTDYPWTIICDGEENSGDPKKIQSTKPIPIGTRIYWEYSLRTREYTFQVLKDY